jgi:hypothetical protein
MVPLLSKVVKVYQDNFLVCSVMSKEYILLMNTVLGLLSSKKLFLKASSCLFSRDSIPFLSKTVISNGVTGDHYFQLDICDSTL